MVYKVEVRKSRVSYLEYPEKVEEIVGNIRKFLALRQAAWASKISDSIISVWMIKGREDMAEGNDDTPQAKFHIAARAAQAEKIGELIENIELRRDGWQANAWLLERCFREDFGSDAAKMAELTDDINKLREMFEKFKKPSDVYGAKPDEQVDSKGDKAKE